MYWEGGHTHLCVVEIGVHPGGGVEEHGLEDVVSAGGVLFVALRWRRGKEEKEGGGVHG